jgi:hypothetical protein
VENKYWYVSYVKKNLISTLVGDTTIKGIALMNFHPFKAVNQWNRDDELHSFVIISFQEISKEEYDIATEGEND